MYFSYTRTALKVILVYLLNNTKKKKLLVPDFICDTIIYHIKKLKIEIIYYQVNKNLTINWKEIQKLDNLDDHIGILIVNYFGFPINLDEAINFCNKQKLILIEDNSHGHYGYYKNKELGTYGDFGFSSPRKHLPILYGGYLYNKITNKININLDTHYKTSLISKFKIFVNLFFLSQKLALLKFFKPNQNKIKIENYVEVLDSKIDKYSLNKILKTNWDKIKYKKVKNYLKIYNFFKDSNYKPLFKITSEFKEINPWCCPIITKSEKEALYLLNWAKRNSILAFSWPTLPKEVSKDSISYINSKVLVCISCYNTKKFDKSLVLK